MIVHHTILVQINALKKKRLRLEAFFYSEKTEPSFATKSFVAKSLAAVVHIKLNRVRSHT